MDSALITGIVLTVVLFIAVMSSFAIGGGMMREQTAFGYNGQRPGAGAGFIFGMIIFLPLIIGLSIVVSKDDDDDEDDN